MDKTVLDLSTDDGTIKLVLRLYRLGRVMESVPDAARLHAIVDNYCFFQGRRNKDGVHRLMGTVARLRTQLQEAGIKPDM